MESAAADGTLGSSAQKADAPRRGAAIPAPISARLFPLSIVQHNFSSFRSIHSRARVVLVAASGIIFPMKAVARFRSQLRASWKWALSFRSHDWELEDYPISVRRQEPDPGCEFDDNSRLKQDSYVASIVNWNVTGSGNSQEEAFSDLLNWFAIRKAKLAEE